MSVSRVGENSSVSLIKDKNSIGNTMTTVNTKGLMLGMLAISGLIGGALIATPAAYAQSVVNAATAANSDDDTVTQSNSAYVTQKSKTKCEAEAESENDDSVQVGSNTNTAINDCDTTQTSTVTQANANIDNDVQAASAEACQSVALLLGVNVCGNEED